MDTKKLTQKITQQFDVKKIIVFGSFARGDIQENSDLNILIIIKDKIDPEIRLEKCSNICSALDYIQISPLVYTSSEISRLKKSKHPLITSILEEGKVIYENR